MQMTIKRFLLSIICAICIVPAAHAWSWPWENPKTETGKTLVALFTSDQDVSFKEGLEQVTAAAERDAEAVGKKVSTTTKTAVNTVQNKANEINQAYNESEFGKFVNDKDEYLASVVGLISKYTWEKNAVYMYNQALKDFPNAGNVEFHPACDMDEDKNVAEQLGVDYKSTTTGVTCVDSPFNWINVNAREAWNLSRDYAKQRLGVDVICSPLLRQAGNDDFIMCSAVDNSAKYYEFKFDDVRETLDDKVHMQLKQAICEQLFGGKKNNIAGTEVSGQARLECLELKSENECNELQKVAQTYVSNMEVTWKQVYGSAGGKVNACVMKTYDVRAESELNKVNLLRNDIFRNFQFNNQTNLEEMIERYVRRRLGTSVETFTCDKSTWTYDGDDDGITCHINGQPMDFIFDDIRELDFFNVHSNEASAGMACLGAAGGIYDGKACHGLQDEAACTKFSELYPEAGGTRWDDELGLCILINSEKAETFKNWVDGLTAAGFIVVGIAATVATAGAASPFLVVMGAVGVAGTIASTAGTVMTIIANNKYPDESRLILGKALNVCPSLDPKYIPRDCPTTSDGKQTADYGAVEDILGELEVAFFNSAGADPNLDTALEEVIVNCVTLLTGCWSEEEREEVLARVAGVKDDAAGCGGNLRGWANCLNTIGAVLGVASLAGTGFYKTGLMATKLDDAMAPLAKLIEKGSSTTKNLLGVTSVGASTTHASGATTNALKTTKAGKATSTVGKAVSGAKAETQAAVAAKNLQTATTEVKMVKTLETMDNVGTGKDSVDAATVELDSHGLVSDSIEIKGSQYIKHETSSYMKPAKFESVPLDFNLALPSDTTSR